MGGVSVVCLLVGLFVPTIFAQEMQAERPLQCKQPNKERGKYKTLFTGASGGTAFRIYIQVDLKNQTDSNYAAITDELKAKYCRENELYLVIFDSKDHYRLYNIPQPERPITGTPRALYVLNRLNGKELLEVYKIVDGTIEARGIRLYQL